MTGETMKCYAATIDGYIEVPANWKITPWGAPIIRNPKVIREIANSKLIEKQGIPRVDKVTIFKEMAFFTPDGQPLYWYYQLPDGRIDFFPRPGYHPQYKVILTPVNSEIVALALSYVNEGKFGKISAPGDSGSPDSDDVLDGLKKLSATLKELRFR